MQPLPTTTTTDPSLAELITRMDEAADAYMRGDIRRYLQLIPNAPDCSLMPPYGGGPLSTAGRTEADIDATSAYFKNGEATIEVYAAHRSGDLAVLVLIERQHGEVGGTSDQDWSLRITLVFRRDDEQWLLVHRHADPLVHPIDMLHGVTTTDPPKRIRRCWDCWWITPPHWWNTTGSPPGSMNSKTPRVTAV